MTTCLKCGMMFGDITLSRAHKATCKGTDDDTDDYMPPPIIVVPFLNVEPSTMGVLSTDQTSSQSSTGATE